MFLLIMAILLSFAGALALKRSCREGDPSGVFSLGGYILFIISFAMLEYLLISGSVSYVFGGWAAGITILLMLLSWWRDRPQAGLLWSSAGLMIVIGLLGFALA